MRDFNTYLEKTLSQKKSDWRLGKEKYARKFDYVLATGKTPEQTLAAAEADLAATRAEMAKLAAPRTVKQALDEVAKLHATPDTYMAAAKKTLEDATAFVRDKGLLTLPSRGNLEVIETPMFMRGIYAVGGFNPAPVLEPAPPAGPRHRRLEADDTAAGPDHPAQLADSRDRVGECAQPERDRRGAEPAVVERQLERVAEHELQLDDVAAPRRVRPLPATGRRRRSARTAPRDRPARSPAGPCPRRRRSPSRPVSAVSPRRPRRATAGPSRARGSRPSGRGPGRARRTSRRPGRPEQDRRPCRFSGEWPEWPRRPWPPARSRHRGAVPSPRRSR